MYALSNRSIIMDTDETLTLLRPDGQLGAGINVIDGVRIKTGTMQTFTIRANVQPVAGDDLLIVPEGDRFDEQYWLWVQQPFTQPDPNDYVLREGVTFLVMAAETWGSYTKARMQRIDVGPDRYRDV